MDADERVRALEEIRPSALHAVPTAVRIWRRPNLAQLSNGAFVLERFRLSQQFSIGHGIARRRVGHLARAHERVEEIGPRLHHVDAKDRSPRVADEDDLVLAQLLAQQVGELDAVLRHARDRDGLRRRIRVLSECSAGAALIPLDDGEVLQPQPEPGVAPRIGRVARSAVKKEQHRVIPVFSANRDPLLDAADLDVPGFIDAVWRGDGVVARVPRAQGRPCRFELLGVGAGRRILPAGRGGDANEEAVVATIRRLLVS